MPGEMIDGASVRKVLDVSLQTRKFNLAVDREIAFYGGTFTRLSESMIKNLLGAVEPYLKQGYFKSVRVSTRPDEIDEKRLGLIKGLGVDTVELGVQSLDDEVLDLSQRGHTSDDTMNSFRLLRENGFHVGVQLMPGLPGDTAEKFRRTIEKVAALHPDSVRLYPTIVIKGTKLAQLYKAGKYIPLSLREAIDICTEGCIKLEEQGIPVIRMGLMSSPSLLQEGQILAGPWHNAFGFLVRSAIHQRKIEDSLPKVDFHSSIGIRAPRREIPFIRGYRNEGLRYLEEKTGARIEYIKVDDNVPPGTVKVDLL